MSDGQSFPVPPPGYVAQALTMSPVTRSLEQLRESIAMAGVLARDLECRLAAPGAQPALRAVMELEATLRGHPVLAARALTLEELAGDD
jgi:hypothetical protein